MVSITASPSGADQIGQVIFDDCVMKIYDSIFIITLTEDIANRVIEYLDNLTEPFGNITILQLDTEVSDEDFEAGLKLLIDYGVYHNQKLCERLFVTSINQEFTDMANEAWKNNQKAITKFNGRKWPTEDFVSQFSDSHDTMNGSGSVSPAPEKINFNDIVSWRFDIGVEETETIEEVVLQAASSAEEGDDSSRSADSSSDNPTLEPGTILKFEDPSPGLPYSIPQEKVDQVLYNSRFEGDKSNKTKLPPEEGIVVKEDDALNKYGYSYIYHYHNEYTTFPLVESHAKPTNNLVTTREIERNTLTCHIKYLREIEIKEYEVSVTPDDGGGS